MEDVKGFIKENKGFFLIVGAVVLLWTIDNNVKGHIIRKAVEKAIDNSEVNIHIHYPNNNYTMLKKELL